MNLLFKLTSRSRPDGFFRAIDSVRTLSDGIHPILCTLDEDDETMNTPEVRRRLSEYALVKHIYGQSENKIHAINRDMDQSGGYWDIIVNLSDDQVFTIRGFDKIIIEDMIRFFPDTDGFLHYNDGNQKANVPTMSIIGRKYYERFNCIYPEEYKSLWADVEVMEVAKMLGKIVYLGDDRQIFKHLHPAWGLAEWDEQYKRTESKAMWEHDEHVYKFRKQNKFFLKS